MEAEKIIRITARLLKVSLKIFCVTLHNKKTVLPDASFINIIHIFARSDFSSL